MAKIITLFLLVTSFKLNAQNLIINPDFEQISSDSTIHILHEPGGYDDVYEIPDSMLTEDKHPYYESAKISSWSHEKVFNKNGFISKGIVKLPHSGKNFAELCYFGFGDKTYYVSDRVAILKESLIKDSNYLFEMHIRPFFGNFLAKDFLVLFTDKKYDFFYLYDYDKKNFKYKKQTDTFPNSIRVLLDNDTNVYQKIKIEYKAKGGERYINFGNLYGGIPETIYPQKYGASYTNFNINKESLCYYMIDDFSLTLISDTALKEVKDFVETSINTNDSIIQNISDTLYYTFYFSKNSFQILNNEALNFIPNTIDKLVITGYTSEEGSVEYNNFLAHSRVKEVINTYFLDVSKTKIEEIIIGETNSDRMIEKNRRVQIMIIQSK